jgi:hypothetical protein
MRETGIPSHIETRPAGGQFLPRAPRRLPAYPGARSGWLRFDSGDRTVWQPPRFRPAPRAKEFCLDGVPDDLAYHSGSEISGVNAKHESDSCNAM